ncbi:hypothetical protein Cantr_01171 [Candida viswanathii]|uniref:Uncharacterized protein n=1 Tax=Candida viswanathii TaxID=5486 RepID=A0A367YHN6_9ASCO|nr:hypothetical protein Cantr_01171 [Candida viswanathii]
MGTNVQTIPICNNSYPNLKFDLMDATKNKNSLVTTANGGSGREFYEIEIPKKLVANCVIPDDAGFTTEPLENNISTGDNSKKIREVELKCSNIKVSSGLHLENIQQVQDRINETTPPLPDRRYSPADSISGDDMSPVAEDTLTLPSYDDVVREEDNQSARRRYQA